MLVAYLIHHFVINDLWLILHIRYLQCSLRFSLSMIDCRVKGLIRRTFKYFRLKINVYNRKGSH